VSEGSSLHLYAPENAVNRPTVSVLLEQGTPTTMAEIDGVQRDLILDTGSNISILQPGVSRSDMRCTSVKPYGVTDEILEIRDQQTVSFVFNEHEFKHSFYVCTLPTKAVGLIGMDFMGKPVPQSISKRARCHLPSSREGRSWLVLHTPGK
jgi:hypothetical protein